MRRSINRLCVKREYYFGKSNMHYLKLLFLIIYFTITKPIILLTFLAGVYCLTVGIMMVLQDGF